MIYVVHTRQTIQRIDPDHPHVIISISDREDTRPKLPLNAACLAVLKMTFHDVNSLRGRDPKIITVFDRKMADEILDFWLAHRNAAAVAYIHCDGGQCRSPGVAAALQKLETGDDEHWFKTKTPNTLVRKTILERAYTRKLQSV